MSGEEELDAAELEADDNEDQDIVEDASGIESVAPPAQERQRTHALLHSRDEVERARRASHTSDRTSGSVIGSTFKATIEAFNPSSDGYSTPGSHLIHGNRVKFEYEDNDGYFRDSLAPIEGEVLDEPNASSKASPRTVEVTGEASLGENALMVATNKQVSGILLEQDQTALGQLAPARSPPCIEAMSRECSLEEVPMPGASLTPEEHHAQIVQDAHVDGNTVRSATTLATPANNVTTLG